MIPAQATETGSGVPAQSYAGVHILDNPFCIDKPYHYYIPAPLLSSVTPGAFVTVPFGRGNRKKIGLVVSLCAKDGLEAASGMDPDDLKPVDGVCRERLFLSEEQLSLCLYLKEQTLCTIGEAVRTVVPPKSLATLADRYEPIPDRSPSPDRLSAAALLILDYIRSRGAVSGQSIRTRFGSKSAASLDELTAAGFLRKELTVDQPREKTETRCALTVSADEAEAALRGDKGAARVTSPVHKKVLEVLLAATDSVSAAELRQSTGATPAQLRSLSLKGLISCEERPAPLPGGVGGEGFRSPFTYSEEQAAAVAQLTALADTGEARAALLHGVTGSGKTCVMLSMIDRMLDVGKGSIVLLPEISLTPQMLSIFHSRYGRRVAVIHSGLSAGERQESFERIRAGLAPVVVGTRSAVFAPVPDLGMIVIDEEQEHTYKSDMDPKYHARDVARFRCAANKALLLLASATPSIESYRKAEEGRYTLISMKQRYGHAVLPRVDVVDMRSEARTGSTAPLSRALTEQLGRVTGNGEQAILFINRRGYSTQIVCRSCGKAILCPHCSVAMNYHTGRNTYESGEMVCHWCGTRRKTPDVCPDCGSAHLARMGFGTQRIQQELESLVRPDTPDRPTDGQSVRVMRMDADTTTTKGAYFDLLSGFRQHEADILLGTQMVTKGHDFPDVTLVGVLLADMSLYSDDFRAAERTFSLLTQVIGRAGRADKPGLAVIQTMNPDSDVIKAACAQDYETFYKREIRLRQLLTFPPFCDIALLTVTSPDEKELQKAVLRLSEQLDLLTKRDYTDVPIQRFGPFEAPVYRVDNVYRMRVVIKCRLNKRCRAMFADLHIAFTSGSPSGQKPVLSIDFNPSSL